MADVATVQARAGGIGPLLRRKDVERETGLCRSAIYQYMAENRFPKPVKIGPRAVAWPLADIEKWKATRLIRT